MQPDESDLRPDPVNPVVVIGAIGVAAGVLMAIFTIFGGQTGLTPRLRPGAVEPSPVPVLVQVGSPAADFTTVTPAGERLNLRDYRGSAVALNFWATGCGPCVVEMPELQQAADTYPDGELVVIGVNAGETQDAVSRFIPDNGISFPIAMDESGDIVELYGIQGFPTTIWIDAEGIIQAKHIGVLSPDLIEAYTAQVLTAD